METRKRSHSEECVQIKNEEPSSTTTISMQSDPIVTTTFGFKHFNQAKIHHLLLKSSSFIKAINLVEDLIENENLNIYYSHVCIPELRSVNIFDKKRSSEYSDQIKLFLCELVSKLELTVNDLPEAYSHFVGNYVRNSSLEDDSIQYDNSTIRGIIRLETSKKTTPTTISKQIFFLFVKTLHEIAHAAIYKSGRVMMSTPIQVNKNQCFSTPATHALSGEAGNAIERLLFGSVIGSIGKTDHDCYLIKQIVLQEQKPSGVIDILWLNMFIGLDLKHLNEIPVIVYSPLTTKKLKAAKSSVKCIEAHEADDDDDCSSEDEEEDDDDYDISDGNDEPVLTRSCPA